MAGWFGVYSDGLGWLGVVWDGLGSFLWFWGAGLILEFPNPAAGTNVFTS